MTSTTANLWVRPREVLIRVTNPNAGPCGAKGCGRPLTHAVFAWDHRITDDMYRPGPWVLGEDSFPAYRHTDGTGSHLSAGSDSLYFCWPLPVCECGAVDQNEVTMEGYGDWTRCRACGKSTWYDRGD